MLHESSDLVLANDPEQSLPLTPVPAEGKFRLTISASLSSRSLPMDSATEGPDTVRQSQGGGGDVQASPIHGARRTRMAPAVASGIRSDRRRPAERQSAGVVQISFRRGGL